MKNKNIVFMVLAIASVSATISQAGYRRGGLFGGGGLLGTGIGASRHHDYYSSEPGLISRTGSAVGDVAADVTGGRRYYDHSGRRYGRRGHHRRGYRRNGRRVYDTDGYRRVYDHDEDNQSTGWFN